MENFKLFSIGIALLVSATAVQSQNGQPLTPQQKKMRQNWCSAISMNYFNRDFLAKLANRLEVSPLSFQIFDKKLTDYKTGTSSDWNDPKGTISENFIEGQCEISLSHSKGVEKVNIPLPPDLWPIKN